MLGDVPELKEVRFGILFSHETMCAIKILKSTCGTCSCRLMLCILVFGLVIYVSLQHFQGGAFLGEIFTL